MTIDLSKLRGDQQPAEGPPCSRCGHPMPPLPPELAAIARTAGGVVLAHETCPGEEPTLEGRYFEVRVSIVEVADPPTTDDDDPFTAPPAVEEMVSFIYGHRAENLDEAMRPLALGLGEKWALAEKQAKVADA